MAMAAMGALYIPLGLKMSDRFETVPVFPREEVGQFLGKKMANESHTWYNRVLRN